MDRKEETLIILKWAGIIALIAVIIIAVIAAGPRLTEGVVVDKDHAPARTEIQYVPMINSDGSNYILTNFIYHPEEWSIRVEGYDKDDKPRTEWWATTEAGYAMFQIGDHVTRNPETNTLYRLEEE